MGCSTSKDVSSTRRQPGRRTSVTAASSDFVRIDALEHPSDLDSTPAGTLRLARSHSTLCSDDDDSAVSGSSNSDPYGSEDADSPLICRRTALKQWETMSDNDSERGPLSSTPPSARSLSVDYGVLDAQNADSADLASTTKSSNAGSRQYAGPSSRRASLLRLRGVHNPLVPTDTMRGQLQQVDVDDVEETPSSNWSMSTTPTPAASSLLDGGLSFSQEGSGSAPVPILVHHLEEEPPEARSASDESSSSKPAFLSAPSAPHRPTLIFIDEEKAERGPPKSKTQDVAFPAIAINLAVTTTTGTSNTMQANRPPAISVTEETGSELDCIGSNKGNAPEDDDAFDSLRRGSEAELRAYAAPSSSVSISPRNMGGDDDDDDDECTTTTAEGEPRPQGTEPFDGGPRDHHLEVRSGSFVEDSPRRGTMPFYEQNDDGCDERRVIASSPPTPTPAPASKRSRSSGKITVQTTRHASSGTFEKAATPHNQRRLSAHHSHSATMLLPPAPPRLCPTNVSVETCEDDEDDEERRGSAYELGLYAIHGNGGSMLRAGDSPSSNSGSPAVLRSHNTNPLAVMERREETATTVVDTNSLLAGALGSSGSFPSPHGSMTLSERSTAPCFANNPSPAGGMMEGSADETLGGSCGSSYSRYSALAESSGFTAEEPTRPTWWVEVFEKEKQKVAAQATSSGGGGSA